MTTTDRAWVATRKGLFELRRGGAGWRIANVSFLAEPVSMLLPPRADGRMLVALNLGHFGVKLHASDDAGARWREVAAPAYPQAADGATLQQVWSLEDGTDGSVWCGTLPGGLFRSRDFGAGGELSWQLVESLWMQPSRSEWSGGGYDVPGIHSICPHPSRPGEVLAAVSSGGSWITRDDGASWAVHTDGMRADFMPPERAADPVVQDPHRIVRCAGAPDVLWCQHHCGIWRSADAGLTWQQLEAPLSSFGFAVAAHPRDPLTAWFVPAVKDEKRVPVGAALAVNRTRDGGRSFETLRRGLPQQDCYDLVYRHGLEVADDGTSLLMGSTTGGLWASDDGGNRWQAVALHLPPIYALRFG